MLCGGVVENDQYMGTALLQWSVNEALVSFLKLLITSQKGFEMPKNIAL